MHSLRLIVCEDKETGLPGVNVLEGETSKSELNAIATFVRKNFEWLLTKDDGHVVSIAMGGDDFGAFRLTFDRETAGRCPQFFLQATEALAEFPADRQPASEPTVDDGSTVSPQAQGNNGWVGALLSDLRRLILLSCENSDEFDWSSVRAVLQDMQRAANKSSDTFALLLLVGYLYAGESACAHMSAPYQSIYRRAGNVLAKALSNDLPSHLFDEFAESSPDSLMKD